MTGLIVPAATAAATTATLWFIPILVAAVSFYQYDKTDPEGRPKDTKVRVEVRERRETGSDRNFQSRCFAFPTRFSFHSEWRKT